jgi:C-terminal peptidase prc
MNRLWNAALLAAGACLLFGTAGRAAEEKNSPTPRVLLIGAGEFKDAQIKARPTAVADADALYDLLTDAKYFGAAKENATLLVSGGDAKRGAKDATRENILAALKLLAEKAGKDDPVVIGIFGQGASVGEKACVFASDSTFKDRGKTAITSTEIREALAKLKSQKVLALLDVNLKGFDAGDEAVIEPKLADLLRAVLGTDEKEESVIPNGRVAVLATRNVNGTNDLEKNGLFTTVALEALKGAADKDGYEPDGVVTVDELTSYLEKELPKQAAKVGKSEQQKAQTPIAVNGPQSHYALTFNPEVRPAVEKRVAALDKLLADKKITAEVHAEGVKLVTLMPKLNARQQLRKDFQKLADGKLSADKFLEGRTKLLASMELNAGDAREYANKVFDGIDVLKQGYVKDLNSGQLVAQGIKNLYKRLEEPLPDDLKERLEGAKGLSISKLKSLLVEARTNLGRREDLDGDKAVEMTLALMLNRENTDPYTVYIDKEEVKKFQQDMTGNFTGIGIQIRRDVARDGLLVVTPIKGSPAYKAGVKAGDLITTIILETDPQGKKLPEPKVVPTKGMETSDAVKLILGEPGTKVKLVVQRDGEEKPKEFEISRGKVEVETVLGYKRKADDAWDFFLDPESKIGYIRLTQFGPKSFKDMEAAVKELDKAGMKGLVLDLRFNPGGLLTAARDITDLFIDDGLIVTVRPRVGTERPYFGEHENSFLNFPMVCMVNGMSASGSEIVSAALQDHKRAVIVGERSYGKGSVQNIQEFAPTGGIIKLTTASFWRPNNKNLSKAATKGTEEEDWGVRPDKDYFIKLEEKERDELFEHLRDQEVISKAPTKPKKEFKDRQLETAVDYLKGQIKLAAKPTTKKAG